MPFSTTFYTLRHAQSDYNSKQLYTGMHNPDLSPLGKEQAESLDLSEFDLIMCSDLKRCINTVTLSTYVEDTLLIDVRLRELSLGNVEGKPYNDMTVTTGLSKGYKQAPLDYRPLKGETYRQAYLRVLSLLHELIYRNQFKSENVLLCTSSGVIRIIKALSFKPSLSSFHNIRTETCELTKHSLNITDLSFLHTL